MTLPGWLTPLGGADEQREIDTWAIESAGVPSLDLMERAGVGLARLVGERAPTGKVAVLCGKGNNGGDGLVAARILREEGREVDVLALGPLEELKGDARVNLERLPGSAPRTFGPQALDGAAAVLDAMLGTGFEGEPREPVRSAIDAARDAGKAGAAVIAADVPSGVNASTGEVAGAAVQAQATATFHAAKPGLWIAPGKQHAGDVAVVPIGVPRGAPERAQIGLIDPAVLELVPRRDASSTKFAGGSVLVCGGSTGLTGAPSMAAEAAMRAGAGYVTVAVPRGLHEVFELRLVEVMSVPLDDEGASALVPAGVEKALEQAERVEAVVLGPGAGRGDGTFTAVRELAGRVDKPLVLDADGLNAHAGSLDGLAARRAPTVLTPHAGELARLLGISSQEVAAQRLRRVREAAQRARAIVVLKGDDTLVAVPDGRVAVSRGGSPALATAGTGDVLSGVLGAFLAKDVDPFAAAAAAVFLHARAGVLAAAGHGPDGVIARDVIAALPHALGA
ncbi:MAG: ADP-dependent NAD(P)H-hydrate dehydratase / NAD(P)H-hydrate epimerase [Solirubrobacteraceae bacterium]|nr:ADP-dependent NAD(P)H-hydrate dehydratase / NAD(P)H-hydrate epimerase [Solirubrobacteraceae bacterium]